MSTKHLIYTTGVTIYSKTVKDSTPWADDVQTVTEDPTFSTIYPIDLDHPHVYLQAGGSPASTDTYLGNAAEFYYGTVEGGDLYFNRRFHTWDWANGTLEDKVKAMYQATESIDQFCYAGDPVEEDQGLQFPRDRTEDNGDVVLIGDTADVPEQIVESAYLIAEALMSGRDPQTEFEAQNVKVETFGPIRTEMATGVGPQAHISNLIPSPVAWTKILPFLRISTSFSVRKA